VNHCISVVEWSGFETVRCNSCINGMETPCRRLYLRDARLARIRTSQWRIGSLRFSCLIVLVCWLPRCCWSRTCITMELLVGFEVVSDGYYPSGSWNQCTQTFTQNCILCTSGNLIVASPCTMQAHHRAEEDRCNAARRSRLLCSGKSRHLVVFIVHMRLASQWNRSNRQLPQ
jgi:hypothetical protein